MKHLITLTLFSLFLVALTNAQDAKEFARLAELKYKNQNYPEAIELYNRAIALDSTTGNFYTRRGFLHTLVKDFDAAIDDYTKVISLDSKDKFAYLSRGGAYNKLAAYQDAIKDFNKVIVLDPQNWEAYNNRGIARKMLGDMENACRDWKMSKKLGNPEAKIILENNHCK